jgi:hypothetical protein
VLITALEGTLAGETLEHDAAPFGAGTVRLEVAWMYADDELELQSAAPYGHDGVQSVILGEYRAR